MTAVEDKLGKGLPAPSRLGRRWPALEGWSRLSLAGLGLTGAFALIAVVGPLLMTHDPMAYSYALNETPSASHWLGTDDTGQDVYSRLLLGARLSLGVGAAAAFLALLIGAGLALVALALGRWAEFVVFALVDLVRALPWVLFALALIVALEPGATSVVIALSAGFSPYFARITKATYELEMAKPYTQAAKVLGAGPTRVALRHVAPNIAGALLTQFTIILPRCIVSEAVLSFLGLGVSPEVPTWGRMIASAVPHVEEAPHTVLFPIVVLSLLTFGLAIVGDALRGRFDPGRRRIAA
ncbi:MAG: ABC transporter permease [Hyphomicrobiales bacterium]|nr:ABC transporter permease [Hyphomicrobiales bacterium]